MSTSLSRLRRAGVAVSAAAALAAGALVASPASANPGDGGPGGAVGAGEVQITSATKVAKGQRVFFAGEGFAVGGNTAAPVWQKLSVKLDAFSSTQTYHGTGGDAQNLYGPFQVQGDGTVSGSIVVPDDIDDPAANDSHAGPHFLRFLGSNPAASRWTDDFTVAAGAPAGPAVTATAATASSRGTTSVTITVTGSGFAPGEDVSVERALADEPFAWAVGSGATATTQPTIKAGADGTLSGRVVLAPGALPAGERQLVLRRSSAPEVPAVVQVDVDALASFANLALDTDGTVTIVNAAPGAVFSSVELDPTAAAGDEVELLAAPITANASGAATGTVSVPDGAYLGTRTFRIEQTYPYADTLTVTAKVSPSAATSGEDRFEIRSTADGAIEQGLYQSAYSERSDALFVTTANVLATSRIYKLDPDTLEVLDSVQPAYVDGKGGNLWAAYGVGVDDEHGTVWVTNTRQNTVAVYAQDDLRLLRQLPADTLDHTRDVVADPVHDVVYVSSASEGTQGDGGIGVFEADDLDGDGVKYELIETVGVLPRTEFSPMSLELDVDDHKLFTVSLSSQRAMVIDTDTLEETVIELPDLMTGGRGASGVAYDDVTNRLFVASQNSDEVLIAQLSDDLTTGTTLKEVPTGAGALNVAFDPVNRWAYVSNFGGTTITVLDVDGNKIANLPFSRVNHMSERGDGSMYAVNKDTGNRVIKVTPKAAAGTVAVAGKARVGTKLTARTTGWPAGATLRYQWTRGGAAIKGATKAAYTPVAADRGRVLAVTVTGTVDGLAPATATAKAGTVAAGVLTAAKPRITGTPKVGGVLKAAPGRWTAGTKLTFRWFANGTAVKGATGKQLRLTAALVGKRVTVKVTGTKAGYAAATKASARTAPVRR